MQRIEQRFSDLRHAGRKALIPYISAGDPDPDQTVSVMHALVASGADVLELGIPFSDPAADGETIQLANERALARGVGFSDVLAMIGEFRGKDQETPVVVMGYLNSFERHGFAEATQQLANAGVDAVILVDCPVEALPDYRDALSNSGLLPILLVAPTTKPQRLAMITREARGFIYYVSLRGVTGKQQAQAQAIAPALAELKTQTDLPVCVGFGIRDSETAHAMAEIADGVVIGSALVSALNDAAERNSNLADAASEFLTPIRAAMDQ
ncbi:tryptophan synthase subunit alpha [Suttonella sp. R2A3]|uniref:tryptophan synthase subunit alpha n=1 Tax=Suttonella sp. R2A3 TaxID=2908648 RepID=UPI001F4571FB|nr:tryptophan synthase subunit alpha [Suttonella sp. R2A3]UJF24726.1 tryptophan synthase subunit alpha [Suttonella sp. R2A3]